MKWHGSLAAPRINMTAYREKLRAHMAEVLSYAAMQWLMTVLEEVPVWSGASRATFVKLAAKINFNVDIQPVVPSRIGMGLAESDFEWSLDEGGSAKYYFRYSTTLAHLIFNEYHNANAVGHHLIKPGPYYFQQKGIAAFQGVARSVKLPSLKGCVKPSKRIKV